MQTVKTKSPVRVILFLPLHNQSGINTDIKTHNKSAPCGALLYFLSSDQIVERYVKVVANLP